MSRSCSRRISDFIGLEGEARGASAREEPGKEADGAEGDQGGEDEVAPSLKEFEACMLICDQRGWANGLRSRVTQRMKWNISDEGRAALLEL